MIKVHSFRTSAAVGADGSASGIGRGPSTIAGEVLAIHVAYLDSPPATTDLTIYDDGDPAAEAILTLVDANTDIKVYPRRVLEQNDGTDLTFYGPYVVAGRLKAAMSGANADDMVEITVWYRQ